MILKLFLSRGHQIASRQPAGCYFLNGKFDAG